MPTGLTTSDFKFRQGGLGIGFTTYPSFGSNQFIVNGNSSFTGNVGIDISTPVTKFQMLTGTFLIDNNFPTFDDAGVNWGIKSQRSIVVQPTAGVLYGEITLGCANSLISMSVAKCMGCYSFKAVTNDAVLRGNTNGSFVICNEQGGNIKFETTADPTDGTTSYFTSKTQMLIDKTGNIGIGTVDNPIPATDKLAVNGLIHTKEVKVDLIGWPDYVFEKQYHLATIDEVEKQINTYGHLQDIPSANDVEKNGVLLGEMNKKLLQKIEELTLYIIKMNKDIEYLKSKK